MDFRPFVIRAYLSSPVAGLGYLPIDGILLNLACQRAYGQLPTSLKPMQLPEFDPAVSPLQIIRYGDGDSDWIYQASFARWGDRALSQDFFTRRHNITEAEIFTSRKWETGRGEYRNVYHKFEQIHDHFIEWLVVGDGEEIADLLQDCPSIGKYRHKGRGQVLKWQMIEVPLTVSQWDEMRHRFAFVSDGNPLRALPMRLAKSNRLNVSLSARLGRMAVRPPYWYHGNYEDCYLP